MNLSNLLSKIIVTIDCVISSINSTNNFSYRELMVCHPENYTWQPILVSPIQPLMTWSLRFLFDTYSFLLLFLFFLIQWEIFGRHPVYQRGAATVSIPKTQILVLCWGINPCFIGSEISFLFCLGNCFIWYFFL